MASALPALPMPRSTTASLLKPRPLLVPFLGMQLAVATSRGPWDATVPGMAGTRPFRRSGLPCALLLPSPGPGIFLLQPEDCSVPITLQDNGKRRSCPCRV